MKTKKVPALPGTGVPTETLTYTYNTLGNPQKLGGDGGAYMAEATYTPYGEPDKYQIGTVPANSAYQTFGYETGTHRLASMRLDRFNQPAAVSTVSYTYDPAGNVTSTTDTSAGQPVDTQCFGYDYLRRLTQAWTPTAGCAAAPSTAGLGGPAPYWQTYTYDKTGNRTTLTSHAAGGDTVATDTYPAPGATRPHFLTSLATAGPAGTSTDTFTDDPVGNTASRTVAGAGQTLTWDAEGHLGSVTTPAGTTSFVYDADGNRLIRRDPTSTTLYLDGAEVRRDKATGALASSRYYTFGGATIVVRNPDQVSTLITDPHNTATTAIANTTGALTRQRTDPYGDPRGPAHGLADHARLRRRHRKTHPWA